MSGQQAHPASHGHDIPSIEAKRETRRVVLASTIGTAVEWFDFLVYATVAGLVFGELFFPGHDATAGTLLALSTFTVGYLARPLGGIVFGHFGDRLGRRGMLVATLLLMGAATFAIGLLPTYESIGVAAPIILVVLRILQGLGAGGEYGGAILMVVEHGHRSGRRGFFGSLPSASASFGFFLASGVVAALTAVLSSDQFLAWGWRIPFLLSAVGLGIGLYIRLKVEESPLLAEAVQKRDIVKFPLAEVLRRHFKAVLISILAPTGMFTFYYILLVFLPPYVTETGDVSPSRLLTAVTISQAIYLPSLVFWGAASDRLGRRIPMSIGYVGLALWAFIMFPLIGSGSYVLVLIALIVALFLNAAVYGPLATFLSELFNTSTRYTGLSVGYQFGGALAGGFAPLIALTLFDAYSTWLPVSVFIAIMTGVSLIVIALSEERAHSELDQ